FRVQPRPGGRECLVLRARMQPELTACRPRAARPRRAGPAVGCVETDLDAGPARWLDRILAPGGAFAPLGAAHASPLPVHGEVGGADRTVLLLLPALVRPCWADQVDAVAFAGDDDMGGADVARVSQVLGR